MSNITDSQLLFLDNLIYLDLYEFNNNSLYDAIKKVLLRLNNNSTDTPADMTTKQWKELLESFVNNSANKEFLNNFTIKNYVTNDSDENGMRAACFVNKNDCTDVVAVFRGTTGGELFGDRTLLSA